MFSMRRHVLLIFIFEKIKWTKICVHMLNVVLFIYCFKNLTIGTGMEIKLIKKTGIVFSLKFISVTSNYEATKYK